MFSSLDLPSDVAFDAAEEGLFEVTDQQSDPSPITFYAYEPEPVQDGFERVAAIAEREADGCLDADLDTDPILQELLDVHGGEAEVLV